MKLNPGSIFLAILLAVTTLAFPADEACAAVSYVGRGNAASGTTSISVPYPSGITAGDMLVLVVGNKYVPNAPGTPSGWTLAGQGSGGQGAAGVDSGAAYATIFIKVAAGTESGNLTVSATSSNTSMARMFLYTKSSGTTWSYAATSGSDETAGRAWSVTMAGNPGIASGDMVIIGSALNGNQVTNWTESISAAGASFSSVAERNDSTSGTGDDMGLIVAEFSVTAGTATAAPVYSMNGASGNATANSPTGPSVMLRLREVPVTTLADGTNPSNATLAPGAAITDLDAFTLKTSSGTDSVTALTVTLTGTNSYQGLSEVRITNSAGTTTYFSAVTNPSSNTVSFSGGTPIPVSTTTTTFKVRITPMTHANMPAPPGATYTVGGTVTAFTSTNSQSGSDAGSATLTIDNASPSGATATSGSTGNAQATLNWTTSASSDFATTSGSVVYRWAASSAGSEVPTEGVTPTLGATNGTATVACLVSSGASTALARIDGTGGSADCTTTALTNGQDYSYKVFQKDTNGNYDVGTSIGPLTPSVPNCISTQSGSWTTAATWTQCRNGIPLAGDAVTIANGHTVTLNTTTPTLGDVTNNGTLTASSTFTLIVGGNFVNAGTVTLGSSNVDLYGNFSNNAGTSFNGASDSGIWTFKGSVVQNVNSTGTQTIFPKLTLNNSAGITLNASISVKTLLTLTNGYISTGTNIVSTLANCPGSLARTNGFVAGNLRLTFGGTTACTFYVGSGTTYAPITLTPAAAASGTLTGSTAGAEHTQISISGLDSTKDVNRHWTLWTTGDTFSGNGYALMFNYVAGDIDSSATASNFQLGTYTAGAWSVITAPTTRTTTQTGATGITGSITAERSYAVGEPGVIDAPCTSPAGMTCVCDNFGRATLNPSTIFGANWLVDNKNQNSTFGNPRIVNLGRLQLTDNSGGVATVANVPGTFPAAGNKITVEFKHYAYGGNGADGIALTLSDSTKTPIPGAFGGSLGYAQKSNPGSDCTTAGGCVGFNGGWVGVAIDEWGNFSANTEGRTAGTVTAPGQTPDSVSVRGSGSGMTGYPYMGGSGTLSPGVDNAGSATAAYGHSYRITVDATAYTWNANDSTGTKTALVSVERDVSGGTAYSSVVPTFDAYVAYPSQATVPTTWKLSFTGSTGGAYNYHEIAGFKVCATSYTPPASFGIEVDNLSPTTCSTAATGKPVVTITARDTNGNVVTDYTKTVTLGTKIGSPTGSNSTTTVWSKFSGAASGTLSGNQYTFVAADHGVAKFYLTDTTAEDIYISISENGGTLSTTLSTPLQYRGTAFTVAIPDALGTGVVAGRNHLMSITRSNGCGTDTTYSGSKALDGWYTPVTGAHPTGAYAPQLCAPNASGTCLPSTGSCVELSIAAPTVNATSNYLPALTFTSGVANFCLATTDVGRYSVSLRGDSGVDASVPVTGSSTPLTVRPFAVVVANVKSGGTAYSGGTANPAASSPSGGKFVPVGSSLSATVAGYLWNSAADTGANGLPGAAADYSTVTAAGILPHYVDTVVLSADSAYTSYAPALAPASPAGTAGTFSNGSVLVNNAGSGSVTGMTYSEVGSFTLKATPSVNYLNSGVDLSNRVAIYAATQSGPPVTGSTAATAWVGRFVPAYFETVPTAACAITGKTAFTYSGQPFAVKITACGAGTTCSPTANYDSLLGYAKATTISNAGTLTNFSSNAIDYAADTSRKFVSGVATIPVASGVVYSFGTPPQSVVPATLTVRATDTDGVSSSGHTEAPTILIRSGRLKLDNAFGSERLPLPVPLTAQYYQDSTVGWVTNSDDSCTASDTLGSYGGNTKYLSCFGTSACTANNAGAAGSVLLADTTGSGLLPTAAKPGTGPYTLTSGVTSIVLTKPSVKGEATMTFTGPSWLTSPTAKLTFGVYKGNSKFIYIREQY